MFYVRQKEIDNEGKLNIGIKKLVYSVQYKHGYPFFTFYEDGRWVTRSAKHYIPTDI